MSDPRPHSRACGVRRYEHGTEVRRHEHGIECHRNCPTCGGVAEPTASDLWEAPRIPPERQSGPGYVMTTHGPVRRATPPWDMAAQEWQG